MIPVAPSAGRSYTFRFWGQAIRKPASCVITPKVRRAHRTTHYRMATSKPTFEVFRDLPLGSIQENSYFMAGGKGLEPLTSRVRIWRSAN